MRAAWVRTLTGLNEVCGGSGGFVSELLEVVFESGGELRIESGCDGVEGLVGFAFVHEVDTFSGGVLCAYEKVFVEVVAGVGLFLADFHRAHGIEGACVECLIDLGFGAGELEEVEEFDELCFGVGFEFFVAELEDGEAGCGAPRACV